MVPIKSRNSRYLTENVQSEVRISTESSFHFPFASRNWQLNSFKNIDPVLLIRDLNCWWSPATGLCCFSCSILQLQVQLQLPRSTTTIINRTLFSTLDMNLILTTILLPQPSSKLSAIFIQSISVHSSIDDDSAVWFNYHIESENCIKSNARHESTHVRIPGKYRWPHAPSAIQNPLYNNRLLRGTRKCYLLSEYHHYSILVCST